ncbi:hypothetical protein PR202_gb06877 [Eleusine coracana subsp. coracana]|uniref:Uncharacterized protein n=1 Tax=Eleusine coracana subsp. coracana TaxID=191504 RepID=A0AAV5E8A2_ELECO|nr:hypothetical protein PR202_gb06877 [Eleusine coracana subsp. coracana]
MPRCSVATHASTISYAVVVSTEVLSVRWFGGREHSKLLLNCLLHTGYREEDEEGITGFNMEDNNIRRLGNQEMEAVLMTFHRFGNQSVASL